MQAADNPVLVIGRTGRLALALCEEASRLGLNVCARGRPDLNIENPDSVRGLVDALAPRAIINAAALVDVDEAERHPERAFAINRDGATHLAGIAARAGIPLVHISTDYVFDGAKATPYTEDDPATPISIYGQSKAEGEQAVLSTYPEATILRTSWVFSPHGKGFVKSMLGLARERPSVRVVADQYGTPTWAGDFAQATLRIVTQSLANGAGRGEIYHLAGEGGTTWFNFAQAIFDGWKRRGFTVPAVEPISVADWPGPAKRPRNSQLDCSKVARTFDIRLPPWQPALEVLLDMLAKRSTP
jgi:dTDP-4-dehydrorhamnose reductase